MSDELDGLVSAQTSIDDDGSASGSEIGTNRYFNSTLIAGQPSFGTSGTGTAVASRPRRNIQPPPWLVIGEYELDSR